MDTAAKRSLIKIWEIFGTLLKGWYKKNMRQASTFMRKCVDLFYVSWSILIYDFAADLFQIF